jgi:nitrogen regulatory protein PII
MFQQRREYEGYRTGKTVSPEFEPRTKVEVVVSDSAAKEIVDDVIRSLSTGATHDGKVFVKDKIDDIVMSMFWRS